MWFSGGGGGGGVCVKKEIFTEMHENLLHSILKRRLISCVCSASGFWFENSTENKLIEGHVA